MACRSSPNEKGQKYARVRRRGVAEALECFNKQQITQSRCAWSTYIVDIEEEGVVDVGGRLLVTQPVEFVCTQEKKLRLSFVGASEFLRMKQPLLSLASLTLDNLDWFAEGCTVLGWAHSLGAGSARRARVLLLRW